jgi:surface polysaccharide O-acyltransferase-like enzyme
MVLVHVSGPGFYSFGRHWHVVNFYDSIAHTAVPLFFMISGALLLPRANVDVLAFYRRRYAKILVPLVFWSVVYLVIDRGTAGLRPTALLEILKGPTSFHLWFVYTIASLYLIVPLLGAFHVHAGTKAKLAILAVAGVSQIYSHFFHGALGLRLGFNLEVFPRYTFFLLAGAFIYEHRQRIPRTLAALAFVAGWAATVALVRHTSLRGGAPSENYYGYNSLNILVATVGLFALCASLRFGRPNAVVSEIADKSFGIYLSHWAFLYYASSGLLGFTVRWSSFQPWMSIPVITVGAMAVSYALCLAMSRVPVLRRLI